MSDNTVSIVVFWWKFLFCFLPLFCILPLFLACFKSDCLESLKFALFCTCASVTGNIKATSKTLSGNQFEKKKCQLKKRRQINLHFPRATFPIRRFSMDFSCGDTYMPLETNDIWLPCFKNAFENQMRVQSAFQTSFTHLWPIAMKFPIPLY